MSKRWTDFCQNVYPNIWGFEYSFWMNCFTFHRIASLLLILLIFWLVNWTLHSALEFYLVQNWSPSLLVVIYKLSGIWSSFRWILPYVRTRSKITCVRCFLYSRKTHSVFQIHPSWVFFSSLSFSERSKAYELCTWTLYVCVPEKVWMNITSFWNEAASRGKGREPYNKVGGKRKKKPCQQIMRPWLHIPETYVETSRARKFDRIISLITWSTKTC